MSCTSCKKKNDFKQELEDSTAFVSKGLIIFTIIWTGLGIYGLISLIQKFL